jgi:hypothetical protein
MLLSDMDAPKESGALIGQVRVSCGSSDKSRICDQYSDALNFLEALD